MSCSIRSTKLDNTIDVVWTMFPSVIMQIIPGYNNERMAKI